MANFRDGLFGSFEASDKIGISLERLNYWQRMGIVQPKYNQRRSRKYRRFSQWDISRAILVKKLVDDEKYSLEGAIKKLNDKGR